MSGMFILVYGGMPMSFRGAPCAVSEHMADVFPCEADAWFAAYQNNLSPQLCRVRCLSSEAKPLTASNREAALAVLENDPQTNPGGLK